MEATDTVLIENKEQYFVGEFTFDELTRRISSQFSNYIITEDRTDYYAAFTEQLDYSMEHVKRSVTLPDKQEVFGYLEDLRDSFDDRIIELIRSRLNITILDADILPFDEIHDTVTVLYRYFVLAAPVNFMVAIGQDLSDHHGLFNPDEISTLEEVFETRYIPFISAIDPMEFLNTTNANMVKAMYDAGTITGNFLLRYTPKLYENELYRIELTNYILSRTVLATDFKRHLSEDETPEGSTDNGQ